MEEREKSLRATDPESLRPSRKMEFLDYFGKDRPIHAWFAEKRTRIMSVVFPPLVRIGLVPDTLSYVGITLLAGVIFYFVREPVTAVLFLAGHVFFDGLDGAYARFNRRASQSGAFTDLVCDQLGMIVVAMLAVFHHLAPPLLGAVYVALYLVVVVFGVLINVMGLGTRITITSKYFLYIAFLVWAIWQTNYIPMLMGLFSVIMTIEVIIGYVRLKRGIRRKYDSAVRFANGDQYTSRLNYALNVAVPLTVLIVTVVTANRIPVEAMMAGASVDVQWRRGNPLLSVEKGMSILGVAAEGERLFILVRGGDGIPTVEEIPAAGATHTRKFRMPKYFHPAFTGIPIDAGVMLAADSSTAMLMGIDLEASFTAGRAVMVFALPMGHVRITAMACGEYRGKRVWLAASRVPMGRTYLIDPSSAVDARTLLEAVRGWYVNAAFPSGLVLWRGFVLELNRTPWSSLLRAAVLDKIDDGTQDLLHAALISFEPPHRNLLGPVVHKGDLLMVSPGGVPYRLPLAATIK